MGVECNQGPEEWARSVVLAVCMLLVHACTAWPINAQCASWTPPRRTKSTRSVHAARLRSRPHQRAVCMVNAAQVTKSTRSTHVARLHSRHHQRAVCMVDADRVDQVNAQYARYGLPGPNLWGPPSRPRDTRAFRCPTLAHHLRDEVAERADTHAYPAGVPGDPAAHGLEHRDALGVAASGDAEAGPGWSRRSR